MKNRQRSGESLVARICEAVLGGSQKGFSRLRKAFPKPSALLDFANDGSLPKSLVVPAKQSAIAGW